MKKKTTTRKHKWIIDESGEIDILAAENMPEFHNGPKCKKCGFEFCIHCNPEGYDTECGARSIPADPRKTLLAEMTWEGLRSRLRKYNKGGKI